MSKFLYCGHGEPTKAIWHSVLGVMLLGATTYNIAAYVARSKERPSRLKDDDTIRAQSGEKRNLRLLSNAIIYGAGVLLEVVQVKRHINTILKGPPK